MTNPKLDRRTFLKSLATISALSIGAVTIPALLDRSLVPPGPHLELVLRLAGETLPRSVFYELTMVSTKMGKGRVALYADDAVFSTIPNGKVIQI